MKSYESIKKYVDNLHLMDKNVRSAVCLELKQKPYYKYDVIYDKDKNEKIYKAVVSNFKVRRKSYYFQALSTCRVRYNLDKKTVSYIDGFNKDKASIILLENILEDKGIKLSAYDKNKLYEINVTRTLLKKVLSGKIRSYKSLVHNFYKISYKLKVTPEESLKIIKDHHILRYLINYYKDYSDIKFILGMTDNERYRLQRILNDVVEINYDVDYEKLLKDFKYLSDVINQCHAINNKISQIRTIIFKGGVVPIYDQLPF